MTADLVSLKLLRKREKRAAKESAAAENRAKYGRTKAERQRLAKLADQERKRLEGHKLEK